jgi:riboflavin biosynthesis pyrimidine reductase
MQNLAHSASFESLDKDAPSKAGTKHLEAGCLDRIHVTVAPIILGDGRPSFPFGPIDRVDQALRPPMGIHSLGDEVLFDCDFAAKRVPVWRANNLARPSQSDEENPSSRSFRERGEIE